MGMNIGMFWFFVIFIVAVVVLEAVFSYYWNLQYHYPHNFTFKKYFAYLKNELQHKMNGDKRTDFEKIVERCQMLESTRNIFHVGGPG